MVEYDSIVHNSVLDVVARPNGKSVVRCSWLYKVNQAGDGSVEKHKARFVAYNFSQGKYANEILKRFYMESNKPMDTHLESNQRKEEATSGEVVEATIYKKFVGSLMYLVNTQQNMCYEFNQLSKVMVRPTKIYWKATKHVLRYLKGTNQYGLWYRWIEGVKL
eukprot:PITA_08715